MRKLFCLILVALLALSSLALAEGNLLTNGDFSQFSGDFPDGWMPKVWYTDQGVSLLTVEPDGYDGSCILVSNLSENDARFTQTVPVEPDTLYRISCMCRAEGIPEGNIGATISIEDCFVYSPSLYDTQGQWQELELYGRTAPDQTSVTIYARVGGYSSLNSGSAWFDNFSMEAVDSIPSGVTPADFFIASAPAEDTSFSAVEEEPDRHTEGFVLLTAIYLLIVLAFSRKYNRSPEREPKFYARLMVLVLAAAFLIRVVFAMLVRGYSVDINCFTAWSEHIFSVGPTQFYRTDIWCDYPPGYLLMLWPVAAIRSLLGLSISSPAYLLLLKFWPILFDLLGAVLIWTKAQKRLGARAAMMLAAFFALNPAAFTDSAAWGQIDSVFTLLIALCAMEAVRGSYISSLISFSVAVLIKPQALLFAPLGLVALVVFVVRDKRPGAVKRFLIGILAALAMLYLTAMLFCFDASQGLLYALIRPVTWLWEQYGATMTGYSYMTINALNAYALLDLNWASTETHPFLTIVAWILFALSYLYCFALCICSKKRHHLPLIGGLLTLLIFTFGPMIHERYLYPALLLLPLGYIYARDRRVLVSMVTITATLLLNELLVLQGGISDPNYGHLQDSESWINMIVSAINVLNALFLSYTLYDICVLGHVLTPSEQPTTDDLPEAAAKPRDPKLHLKRMDVLLMAVVTVLYSVVAFTNLGSTKAPQTIWLSNASGDSVVFDLGDVHRFRMTYYGGICNSNFTVELSNDRQTWTEPYYAVYNQGEIFRWIWYTPTDSEGNTVQAQTIPTQDGSAYVAFSGYEGENKPFQTARYVRISSVAAGLQLAEVAFLTEEGTPLPVSIAEAAHEGELLIDEQDTVAAYPSYYNSTYFDEIYHARTAYEHLHGMNTYEWTHPPLGKVLMMLGIQIFGMTPFGWRFMGTLMGVLMLPVMYLLVKQLTKSTKLAFIAMFLFSVDSMHFTQTRIATIDSYAVFWIMLMYLFMFRYFQTDWRTRREFRRSLIPLGLCGVTMGVAWATKWIGLYASVGLAVLFFWTLLRHLVDWLRIRKESPEDEFVRLFPRAAAITIGFCLVFFVVLPVLIYYFSYYWHLQYHGVQSIWDMFSKTHIKAVIDLQDQIFGYHAGLGGDTHYFRSEWYEWPIIWWPMWYFSGTEYMAEGVISSISCMGNPAVWWFGLVALIFVAIRAAWVRKAPSSYALILIGFASQFLPWVLVPRSTFIYHYFASVPFIIIASVLLLSHLRTRSKKQFAVTTAVLCIAALVLFIAFYPLESGMPIPRASANLLRWFKWYNF